MASKLQIITETYEREISDVASSDVKWKSFLFSAANQYKYSFSDQILIYAQKPDATACAEISFWNERLGRWVNKGAKGIALLDNSSDKPRLHYVFDVSDTNSRNNIPVPLWRVREEYHDDIVEGLEDSFGELSDKSSFAESLKSVANNLIEDNYTDYLSNLMSLKENSFLEEIDEDSTSMALRTVLKSSVAYMLMSRCGIKPDEYFEFEDFQPIYFFNTREVISILGTATSDIAEMGIREIESTVRNLQISEKRENRTFVNTKENVYDEDVNEKTNAERSDLNATDNDLHETGRLSDSRPDTSATEGISSFGQVRENEEIISDESSESSVYDLFDEERTSGTPVSDRPSGERNVRETDSGDGEGTGSDREAEIGKSDVMGSDDEQHSQLGGGNRVKRPYLQLSNHDWNKGGGIPYYYEPEEKNELIRTCEKLKDHRVEIAMFFTENSDRDERGSFIKQYFDNTYIEQILESGQRAGYRAYDDCLHVWRGSYTSREKETYMKWWLVTDHIYGMMLLDKWLAPNEPMLLSEEKQISLID